MQLWCPQKEENENKKAAASTAWQNEQDKWYQGTDSLEMHSKGTTVLSLFSDVDITLWHEGVGA